MSDRLSELQRQRALIQGHLAWLDQEIAAATGKPATSTTPLPVGKPAMPLPAEPAAAAAVATEPLADELIAKFGDESRNSAESVRRGCVTFFVLGMAILLLGTYGLYRYSRNLHAHDAPPKAKQAEDSSEKR